MSLAPRGVTVTVPDGDAVRTLLDSVDPAVDRGEVVALTGPSGSGKSTLLAAAGLLRRPDAGEVVLAWEPASGLKDRDRDRARARDLLSDLGVADRAGRPPRHLSGGERQRVGPARALMAEPRVLLADEPTASPDPRLADDVAALLADPARERGWAPLVVTHGEAPPRHADRRIDLDGGRLRPVPVAPGSG